MTSPREQAIEIWRAGVDAVRPRPLVKSVVAMENNTIVINDQPISLDPFERIIVVGAGKATSEMAAGLIDVIGDRIDIDGWINVPEGTEQAIPGIHVHPARPAGVNEPTQAGIEGTRRIMELVSSANERDLCIALISGGGSALLPMPQDGITLEDKLAVIRFLSAGGADITELNTVRKHISKVKGGGLLQACQAGRLITLVLSDVLGDPLDLIASGPTIPDPSHPADAFAVLEQFDQQRLLPKSIYDALHLHPPTRVASVVPHETIVIGNNAVAVDESGITAEHLGFNHAMQCATQSEGDAETIGKHVAKMVRNMLESSRETVMDSPAVNCLITGGEPTVTLAEEAIRGKGGRNQQLVLAAYQHLLQANLSSEQWDRLAILSGGTDGEDGPTDAAGAVLCGEVHRRSTEQGLNIAEYLDRNNAYEFFAKTGGLLITGPTGTNVCDVRVALVAD